jgi:hypothetical protein
MQSPSASFICEGNWRKAINLFLRDALYNVYLAREFELSRLKPFLEVSLDSYVARYIRCRFKGALPRSRGVCALDVSPSAEYRAAALVVAAKRGLTRVHLDA